MTTTDRFTNDENSMRTFAPDVPGYAMVEALARRAAGIQVIDHPEDPRIKLLVAVGPDGSINAKVIDDIAGAEVERAHPDRITGRQSVHDPLAFGAYFNRHADLVSEVWADITTATVTGVLNAHAGEDAPDAERAGWRDHRVTYALRSTPAWTIWTGLDGKWLKQLDFANHVEDNLMDIINPPGADMLEMVQSFQATRTLHFVSGTRLRDGNNELQYREETDDTAGARGSMRLPDAIQLQLQPFEGSAIYRVDALIRYRITSEGQLNLTYKLKRPDDVKREAFTDVAATIDGLIGDGSTVWYGTPG